MSLLNIIIEENHFMLYEIMLRMGKDAKEFAIYAITF